MIHQVLSVDLIKNSYFENRITINDIPDDIRPRGQERGIRSYHPLKAKILSLFSYFFPLQQIQQGENGRVYTVNRQDFEKFKQRTGYVERPLEVQRLEMQRKMLEEVDAARAQRGASGKRSPKKPRTRRSKEAPSSAKNSRDSSAATSISASAPAPASAASTAQQPVPPTPPTSIASQQSVVPPALTNTAPRQPEQAPVITVTASVQPVQPPAIVVTAIVQPVEPAAPVTRTDPQPAVAAAVHSPVTQPEAAKLPPHPELQIQLQVPPTIQTSAPQKLAESVPLSTNGSSYVQNCIREISEQLLPHDAKHYTLGHHRHYFRSSEDPTVVKEIEQHFQKEGFATKVESTKESVALLITFPKTAPAVEQCPDLFKKCRERYRELFLQHLHSEYLNLGLIIESQEFGLEYAHMDDALYFQQQLQKDGTYRVEIYEHIANPETLNMRNGKHYHPGIYLTISRQSI